MAQRRREPIRPVKLRNGATRYRAVLDVGTTGRRRQRTKTFNTQRDARDWLARTRTAVEAGTYVRRDRRSVDALLDAWLLSRRQLRPSTRAGYAAVLVPVRRAYGTMPAQDVTRAETDRIAGALLDGQTPRGKVRAVRTVALTVNTAAMAWTWAQRDGWVRHNPWSDVELPKRIKPEMRRWRADELQAFLAVGDADEWAAAWRLLALGMRRGEVLALRWSDVDFDALTVAVWRNRVLAGREVVEGEPNSQRSTRVLPLAGFAATLAVLRRERLRQVRNTDPELDYVAADALGRALHPETFGRRFKALCGDAGVPVIRLHDVRHTAGSLMADDGVPVHHIAAWLGHADNAFTLRTYVHSSDEGLVRAGSALAL